MSDLPVDHQVDDEKVEEGEDAGGEDGVGAVRVTGGPSGRQPGAIYQLQGRERRTPFNGASI